MKNLTELERQIVHYNDQYRNGRPEISDQEYDLLLDKLKKEQPNSTLLKKGVIEKIKGSRKVQLPVKMMSLEKEKTFPGLISWLDQYGDPEIIITPKFDGISILATPDKYLTRGDGLVGQDCTKHCKFLPPPLEMVKGEMIIDKRTWKEVDIFKKYKHPRNTVAGWINGDYDPNIPYHNMTFIAYEIPGVSQNKSDQLKYLRHNTDFFTTPFVTKNKSTLSEEVLNCLFQNWSQHYPLDGLVIELNNEDLRKGDHSNGNPGYVMAYKPPHFTEVAETTIKSVELSLNRYGMITPTIIFETVNISGADLSRVNGINMSYIYDWGLYPGEKIKVIRSGEVIPKVTEVNGVKIPFIEEFSSTKEYEKSYRSSQLERENIVNQGDFSQKYMDDWCTCPYCESTLKWDENMVNQFCTNEQCPERKFQGVIDYFRIFEVENIAEGTLRNLWEAGHDSVKKVLNITKSQLLELPGFADKSATDFVNSMKKLKKEGGSLAKHLYASGHFPNLGEKTLQLILDNWKAGVILNRESLVEVKGLGEKTINTFLNGIDKFEKEGSFGVNITYRNTPKSEKLNGPLEGMVFCFTGCRPTSELKSELLNLAAQVLDSFTSKVTHLITKDLQSTSSKIKKAKEQGITICSLDQLIDKLKQYK